MTPADVPNPSDRPLAATKPPENFAAEPIGNTLRTRRVPAAAHRQPSAHSIIAARAKSLALRPARKPQLTIAGAIRSP